MKSNKCLFNKAIFKSDLRRFLPFAIPLFIIYCIILPIIVYSQEYSLPNEAFDMDIFMGYSIASDIFSFGFAGLFAVLLFSYLYKPNMCNAIHALPIGRRGLFITNLLAGYVLLTVPQIIGFFIEYPAIHISSHEPARILLFGIFSILVDSFIFYSTGVLAVMLAGNIFAGAALYFLINFASTAVDMITNVVVSQIGVGISTDTLDANAFQFSPAGNIVAAKSLYGLNYYGELEGDVTSLADICKVMLVYFAISLVIIAVSYVLYKIRKLEVAGDMVAFKILNPVIAVIVAFIGGSVLSLFIGMFIGAESLSFLIMFAVFSFVAFIVTEMILHKTARIFNWKNMLLWAVFCAVSIAMFIAVANYKTNYIPKASEVKKMTIYCTDNITLTDESEIAEGEKFHNALLKEEKKNTNRNRSLFDEIYDYPYSESDGVGIYTISIDYYLKDGGLISRYYGLREDNKELCNTFREFEKKYPPDSIFDKLGDVEYEIVSCKVLPMKDGNSSSVFEKRLTAEQSEKIFEECKKYSQEAIKNYSSLNKEYNEEQYSAGDSIQYEVTFTLKAKNGKTVNTLDEIGYMSDPIGWNVEPEYGYTDDNGEYHGGISPEFYLYCYVNDGTPLYDMIYALETAEK